MPWWRTGVLYQVYPRSFRDTNGDGIGDLRGITERLDHLEWLGIDGIWVNPITTSPNADWGYDVADYCAVDPALGTLDDADELIREATARGIRVILDIVPNHTSDQHAWFVESRSSRDDPMRDWYVWADPAPDGGPPNNWLSVFTGPAWRFDEATGQYYLHNFLPEQPDLNWWSEGVRAAFDDILRFWFDRGVAGFRIDVASMVVKDRQLRDNPPIGPTDHWNIQLRGQRPDYSGNRPEVHDVWRRWRALAEQYDPPRMFVGETHVYTAEELAAFYGDDDELNMGFNFMFLHAPFDAAELRTIVEETEAAFGPEKWPVWAATNHDNFRFPSRWCGGDPAKTRVALMMLLTLRGTPFLYYGDELGLPDTDVARERLRDPVGILLYPIPAGRDPERTPMPWDGGPGAGFTDAGVEPWLPFGDVAACNVAAQRADPDSMLHYTRELIALRRGSADLVHGDYRSQPSPDGSWVYTRGERTTVALNLGDAAVEVAASGTVRAATRGHRVGEVVGPVLALSAAEGVVVER